MLVILWYFPLKLFLLLLVSHEYKKSFMSEDDFFAKKFQCELLIFKSLNLLFTETQGISQEIRK